MKRILTLLSNRFVIWLLMSLPGIVLLWEFAAGEMSYKGVIHETGEYGVRILIVSLVITPLAMMFPSAWLTNWLVSNRRYIGLASFGYIFLHALFFLLDQRVRGVNEQEFFSFGIWTGWLAFVFFMLLAVTSNDFAMKELGRDWKTIQRFVYLAAVLTLLHWVYVDVRHQQWGPAMLHFSPVIVLSVYRVYWGYVGKRGSKNGAG
ncbi:MAG TPA: ferric reductase-like transmembrane domain-containing protein [Chryseosolibacter sp.]|nr:ferric reductase-like transmembrane domain-containing protein [Chryseosolibacter sp.]